MIKNFKWLLLISLTFAACNNDDEVIAEEPLTAGTADFSKYVALGDSFAAGYSDGALFKAGQKNSYPNILAGQFALVGGGAFTNPFMADDNRGGFSIGGNQVPQFPTRLYFNGAGPVNVSGVSGTVLGASISGAYSNMGVPGAKAIHLSVAGYGQANPYFGRFAKTAMSSVIKDAMDQNPTFFSLFIGGNDVLGYATNGGIPTSQDPVAGNNITPTGTFNAAYNALATALAAGGKKGVVANLPYINNLPFFTTVPFNPVPLDAATATQLNTQLLGPVKQILTALGAGSRIKTLSASATNPLLIRDETLVNYSAQITGALTAAGVPAQQAALMGSLYGQARHANGGANVTDKDFVLLTTRTVIGTPQAGVPAPFNTVGVTFPLQDNRVLTASEVLEIKLATDAYNVTIKTAAESNNLAFVDTASILNQLNNGGIRFGTFHMTAAYVTGGTFSLDGVHPSPRGYALIANKFLEAINAKYGSNLKGVDLGLYGIQYPATIQ
ncbi:SGNH/GDSL hydrolase family protein [Flavobacterium xueshanense]|uniref:GDSL-like Lipase/Acylhydrolase n=1 Tax=Flavobacterium xueshanense TaxID=935223 RepID=A0A1I2AV93_9FLAO|nr:G-D-S-L family lipolytic protein [Flavobacterium xueshanense]SFE47881.1 GDSL-like Lipase/Acylhydrolase [Flavobacterium xueshanense]